jgi:hypothetical protein
LIGGKYFLVWLNEYEGVIHLWRQEQISEFNQDGDFKGDQIHYFVYDIKLGEEMREELRF